MKSLYDETSNGLKSIFLILPKDLASEICTPVDSIRFLTMRPAGHGGQGIYILTDA